MKPFGTVEYWLIVLYLLIIAGVGSSFYRRKRTSKDYFLAGRSMAWLPVGISIMAADLSAISVMGVPAWGFRHNLELLVAYLGYPVAAVITIYVFVPFYARLNLYTAYEYLERRFNLQVRLLTSLLFQVLRGAHVAIVIYATSLVINLVTGLPGWECILLMGVVTTFYTLLGGMKGVIWTSVVQFGTVMLGLLAILIFSLGHIQGGLAVAYRTALQAGHLKLFNFSTDPADLTSFWACFLGGIFLALAPLTTDQAILQNLFTTRSVEDCNQSIITRAVLTIPVTLLLFLVGIALFVFYDFNPTQLRGLTNEDAVMPFFAAHVLPGPITALVVAAIFAASMGVMSAGINSLTTAFTMDFYKRLLRPQETPQHYAAVGRMGMACWGAALTGLALFAGRLGALALAYNRVSSFVSGPLLGIFLLAMTTARVTAAGSLLGALAGALVVAFVGFTTPWSFFYLGPLGVAVTVAVGYLCSYLMAPPPAVKVRGLVLGQGKVAEAPAEGDSPERFPKLSYLSISSLRKRQLFAQH
jgi:SSS family transporter